MAKIPRFDLKHLFKQVGKQQRAKRKDRKMALLAIALRNRYGGESQRGKDKGKGGDEWFKVLYPNREPAHLHRFGVRSGIAGPIYDFGSPLFGCPGFDEPGEDMEARHWTYIMDETRFIFSLVLQELVAAINDRPLGSDETISDERTFGIDLVDEWESQSENNMFDDPMFNPITSNIPRNSENQGMCDEWLVLVACWTRYLLHRVPAKWIQNATIPLPLAWLADCGIRPLTPDSRIWGVRVFTSQRGVDGAVGGSLRGDYRKSNYIPLLELQEMG